MKFNKLHIIYFFFVVTAYFTLISKKDGISNVSSTGCGGTGCHGSTANSATTISMDFDGNSSLTSYTPGKKYAVVLEVANSNLIGVGTAKAGFDLNFSAGTLSATPSGTMLMTRELHHTTPKAMTNGSATFSFDWTAPAAGSGTVTINIAANGVNGTGDANGDAWNIKTIPLTEFIAPKKANISTIASSAITTTTATISAQINANGNATSAEVQYGTTTAYGATKAMTPASITGSANTAATAALTGLTPNTTYNYRIKATNTAGDSLSANSTFKTNSAGAAILNNSGGTINLYPNPSSDYAIISGDALNQAKEIIAVNMSGMRFSLPIVYAKSDQIKINTSGLSKGKYFIQIPSGDKTSNLPLLID
ncbi:MAG: fibronectin type III domain-containing protein [Chitinophagales bacterium]|nr:fibronectin type III domain-containing protein [Chitinophagales bacterium]